MFPESFLPGLSRERASMLEEEEGNEVERGGMKGVEERCVRRSVISWTLRREGMPGLSGKGVILAQLIGSEEGSRASRDEKEVLGLEEDDEGERGGPFFLRNVTLNLRTMQSIESSTVCSRRRTLIKSPYWYSSPTLFGQ
jgi:hypothetical protein